MEGEKDLFMVSWLSFFSPPITYCSRCCFLFVFSYDLVSFYMLFFCSFPNLIYYISTLAKMQDLLKLEKLREAYAEHCGIQPTFAQWADAAGVDQKILSKRLKYGIQCKEKMIKSNMRLVVSIAKNFSGVGMDIQDLVLVCSHMIGDFSVQ